MVMSMNSFHAASHIFKGGSQIYGFAMQDENDVLTALYRLEEMHISVEALKVGRCWHLIFSLSICPC